MKLICRFFIELTIESHNKFMTSTISGINKKGKKYIINKRHDDYHEVVKNLILSTLGRKKDKIKRIEKKDHKEGFRHVKIISIRNGRKYDFGNLVGGAKSIPDVLQELGHIHSDAPRNCSFDYLQPKIKKKNKTVDFKKEGFMVEIYENEYREETFTEEQLDFLKKRGII